MRPLMHGIWWMIFVFLLLALPEVAVQRDWKAGQVIVSGLVLAWCTIEGLRR